MTIFNRLLIYRLVIFVLILAAGYSIVGITHFKWMYYRINHPKAEFQITDNENAQATLVEFIGYGCGYCKQLKPAVDELLQTRKDLRYIARPIVFSGGEETAEMDRLTRLALAAGLQDKFWEFHSAFLEYPDLSIPDDFIKETAAVYGVDYDQLIKDSEGKKVKKLVDNNIAAFNHAGLYSVPSFVIGQKMYSVRDEHLPTLPQLLEMVQSAK